MNTGLSVESKCMKFRRNYIGTAFWLIFATLISLPISTTHSAVGATLGFSLVLRGSVGINWVTIVKISKYYSIHFANPVIEILKKASLLISHILGSVALVDRLFRHCLLCFHQAYGAAEREKIFCLIKLIIV